MLDLPAAERIGGRVAAVAAIDALLDAPVGAVRALRGGFAWSRGFGRIRTAEASGSALAGAKVVVTGAPSAASAALAAGLREIAGRIVLSAPSLAACEELRGRLGSGGAEVVAREVAADDAAALTELLRDGGPAAGVIHVLSSTVEPRGLDDLSSLAEQAARTRRELDALDGAAEAAGVGWVVVVGSLAALVGGPGLAPFGIDTAIGDALASRRWGGPGPLWLAVTLDAIEAGDGAATGARGAAIPAREAVGAIGAAIAAPPAPTLVLCRGDIARRMEERRRGAAPVVEEARPVADLSREGLATVYAPPRTDLERVVVELWEDMLGFAPIGVHDSFFELGGDSLTATRLIARLADRVSVRIPLKRVLEKPTVAGVADVVDGLLLEKVASMSDDEAERLLAQL